MNNITNVNPKYYNMPIIIFSGRKDNVYTIELQKLSFNEFIKKNYKLNWHIQDNLDHCSNSINEFKYIQNCIYKIIKY